MSAFARQVENASIKWEARLKIMKGFWRDNSLSIVILGLFFSAFLFGQAYSGWLESNEDRVQHG